MTRVLGFALVTLMTLTAGSGAWSQTQASLRLPLPVEGPTGALVFDQPGPTVAVLTGVLVPSTGPLTSWAPVYATLGADGVLKDAGVGPWVGPVPPKWTKVTREGMVVAGFRFLVRTAPAPVQTRQVQIFWRSWTTGASAESSVLGQRSEPSDQVRIVELRVPDGAVATGLWGQTLGSSGRTSVVQVSLVVTQREGPGSQTPAPPPRGPAVVPAFREPLGPQAPVVPLLK